MNIAQKVLTTAALVATTLSASTLVTVNGKAITSDEVNEALMQATQGRFKSLPQDKQQQLGQRILQEMVMQEVVYNDAKKQGIDKSKEFKEELAKITEQIKKRLAVQLWQKKVADKISVTDKEIKDYYTKNKSEFQEKERVHAYHILVKTEDEAKKLIGEMKFLKGSDLEKKFFELAKANSTGPSASKGGDLGTFTQGQMVPAFDKAVFGMDVGTITPTPVKSEFGYHIIYLKDKKPARTLSLNEVKNFIEQRLKMDKFKTVVQAKMQELEKSAQIVPAKK
ncbi:peptidyl-prolyl cis-trans isomerase [Sulfurimonas sp. HSL-1716]|uniref:peptidylprolyl isomerase n=1 Tax=Hydrocurvibacter sulfurireducens TaxID=3131937 RepID=UPI0031F80BE9